MSSAAPTGAGTFLHVVRLTGLDAAGFAELNAKIRTEPPQGLVFHVNGPLDDGWEVGYWTSKAARDRFIQERIMPAMAGSGGRPEIEDLDLHNSLTEAAAVGWRGAMPILIRYVPSSLTREQYDIELTEPDKFPVHEVWGSRAADA